MKDVNMKTEMIKKGDFMVRKVSCPYKNRDLAKLYYRKLDDNRILIENFKNFMSKNEMTEKYGYSVVSDYFHKSKTMVLSSERNHLIVSDGNDNEIVYRGDTMNVDTFNKVVSTMKNAGYNFVESIRKYKPKLVEIVI